MIDNIVKLNKFVASGKYINAYDFVNPLYTLTYIIDFKGTGKSTAFMNLCVDKLVLGENFAWGRNTKVEFENSRVPDSFNSIFIERGIADKYQATERGVYEIIKIDEKREQRILRALFFYMSKPLSTSSQNALKTCKTIVWDEFINPDFNKPNLFHNAMKLFDTLKRKNIAYVFCLGNKHTSSSDMLEGSGVEFNWDSTANQCYFDKDSSTQAFYIGKHIVTENIEAVEQINRWSKYNEASNVFYQGGASQIPNRMVVNWTRNNVAKVFQPLWKFTMDNQDFCLGKVTNGCFYVKSMFQGDEYPNVKGWFCFYPTDKTAYNKYLHPKKDISHIKLLVNAYSNGILYYDWFNTQEVVKQMLYFVNILEAPEKNTI